MIFRNPSHDHYVRQQRSRELPPPQELAGRIEEANNSAKLLLQMIQSTSLAEIQQNELLKEFAQRCQAASRSMQNYINATSPAPDEDTMLTLIETNDKLAVSLSKYQRAVLNARKAHPLPQSQPGSQAPSQENNPPAGNEPQTNPIPKNRFVPRLSMPRIPLRKKQPEQFEQPSDQSTQHTPPVPGPPIGSKAGAVNTSSGDISPSAPAAPTVVPESVSNGATTRTTATAATGPSTSFQYNSDDFQIENPFADKYSTTNHNTNNSNHNGSRTDADPSLTSNAPQLGDLSFTTRTDDPSNFQTDPPPTLTGGRIN